MIFQEKRKRSEGHPRCDEVIRRSVGLPRRGKAEGQEKAPLGSP